MKYELANPFLQVTVDSLGAEILSVRDTNTKTEYIWEADPNIWGRHAPVLFPIVGRLKNDEYLYQGKTYHMTQHGFARDSEFELVTQTPTSLELVLRSNEQTLKMYPFDFEFSVSYKLLNNMLDVSYHVVNKTNGEMIFGVGGHPGFKIPVDDQVKKSDYYFAFEPAKSRVKIPLVGSHTDIKNRTLAATDVMIEVSDHLFEHDAVIFELNSKTKISLRNDENDYHINMFLDKVPFVGLWSPYPKTADFVCIEPWWGIADDVDSNGQLTDKVGMNKLAAGEDFHAGYQITFHDKEID